MRHDSALKAGKLPPEILADLLSRLPVADPRVVVGPRVGEDAAVIEFGDRYLVAKTDPITFATDDIGWYAVHVNANDIATMGAEPRWFLATLLLPEGTRTSRALAIADQLARGCRELGIALVGGHTEVTVGLDRAIVIGQMLGEVARDALVTSAGARPGDAVLLTKGYPVEATSILARECRETLLRHGLDEAALDRAAAFLYDPGISVVREARLAAGLRAATAMHDPTEGGLATGLRELAAASGVGLRIHRDRLPLLPEAVPLCAALGLDPLGCIASGALLLTCRPTDTDRLLAAYAEQHIPCAAIGAVTEPEAGLVLVDGETEAELPAFERDEIARLFEAA
jgi:hydrogenase expression/formation protein HypE